jgi:hypothetical protein
MSGPDLDLEAVLDELEQRAADIRAHPDRQERYYLVQGEGKDAHVAIEGVSHKLLMVPLDFAAIYSRTEMLADETLRSLLERWQRGDDAVAADIRRRWAESIPGFVADRRAKLRWGILPPPEDRS